MIGASNAASMVHQSGIMKEVQMLEEEGKEHINRSLDLYEMAEQMEKGEGQV